MAVPSGELEPVSDSVVGKSMHAAGHRYRQSQHIAPSLHLIFSAAGLIAPCSRRLIDIFGTTRPPERNPMPRILTTTILGLAFASGLRICAIWSQSRPSPHCVSAIAHNPCNVSRRAAERVVIEIIVSGGMSGGELLQTSYLPNRAIARSRLRNGRCGFSARLFSCRPVICLAAFPISYIAARYERSLSIVSSSGRPNRFIALFRNFNAEALSRALVTYDSSTSPS